MRVSVVVPAYNEEKLLPKCLKSLRKQSYPCEVVVCDNGSSDRTYEIAQKHADKALVERKRGALHAINKGAKSASGDLIAITGADCVVPPDWVKNFVRFFRDPEVITCYGPVDPLEGRHHRYFSMMNYAEKICIRLGLWFVIQGANCMIRHDVLVKVGYFDTDVEVFEENGFFKKIRKLGKVKFVSKNPIKASGRRVDECGKLRLVMLGAGQMLKLTLFKRTGTSKFKVVRQ
jgi:glycosyltransferase involved in cell wall biosynthesis